MEVLMSQIPDFAQIAMSAVSPESYDVTQFMLISCLYVLIGLVFAMIYSVDDPQSTDEKTLAVLFFWPILITGLIGFVALGTVFMAFKGLYDLATDA